MSWSDDGDTRWRVTKACALRLMPVGLRPFHRTFMRALVAGIAAAAAPINAPGAFIVVTSPPRQDATATRCCSVLTGSSGARLPRRPADHRSVVRKTTEARARVHTHHPGRHRPTCQAGPTCTQHPHQRQQHGRAQGWQTTPAPWQSRSHAAGRRHPQQNHSNDTSPSQHYGVGLS